MNRKLRKALSERCKDMGLSDKAIDRLAEIGGEGLADEVTDEEVTAKVDLLVPFAQAMQAEITRKTRRQQPSKKQSVDEGEGDGQDNGQPEAIPEWAKTFKAELESLKKENADLKAEKARIDRNSQIAAKAKELGIPEYLARRIAIDDGADIATELGNFKQELVSNNLMPKGQAHEMGTTLESMKADAKAWASGLPNR